MPKNGMMTDKELKALERPIPLFNAEKGMGAHRMEISPPQRVRPATPDGVVIHEFYPVRLGPDILTQIDLANKAMDTTRKWLQGTPFWQALNKHMSETSGTNKCAIETNERHTHLSLHNNVLLNCDGIHVMAEVHLDRGGRNYIVFPKTLLENFTQKAFDAWIKECVKRNKSNKAYRQVSSAIHAAVTSGKVSVSTIKSILSDYEREESC